MPHVPSRRVVVASALVLAFPAAVAFTGLGVADTGAPQVKLDVPYVPTREPVVDKMLELAKVTSKDYLIDLGSGDGRIPITAAKRYDARGYGVDINPVRVQEAKDGAQKAGVTDKVRFEVANLFETPISEATVLSMYLLPDVNLKLRPRVLEELKPGTRVVSHNYDFGAWKPDHSESVGNSTVHYWMVPAKVGGNWRLTRNGGETQPLALVINQTYQTFEGKGSAGGRDMPIRNGRIEGETVRFELTGATGAPERYEGRFVGGRIAGEGWEAVKES